MPWISGFDGVGSGAYLHDQIGDVFECRIRKMRNMPTSEAHVIADAVLRNAAERVIERIHSELRPLTIALGTLLDKMIVHVGEHGVVYLEEQARVVNLKIFLAQSFGQGKDVILVGWIELIYARSEERR